MMTEKGLNLKKIKENGLFISLVFTQFGEHTKS